MIALIKILIFLLAIGNHTTHVCLVRVKLL